jgi:hypothetical protein
MNHLSTAPWYIIWLHFKFFEKIRADIRNYRCTTGVNDSGRKFTAGVNINNTAGKFAAGINE